jgi:hypothetical protein
MRGLACSGDSRTGIGWDSEVISGDIGLFAIGEASVLGGLALG